MTDKTTLGDRMKKYEAATNPTLVDRLPVIIRVDGKAFHSYTKHIPKKPGVVQDKACNWNLVEVMNLTALKLCEEIQGAQLAYVQSDEISILLHGYKKLTSQGWFNNKLQKMVSISAALASTTFTMESWRIFSPLLGETPAHPGPERYCQEYTGIRTALFDSRAFVLPESEVCNYFIWRQQDATRNSVQMLARALYSHKECYKKNNSELQEMTFQKGRNWNDEPTAFKRGRCVTKVPTEIITYEGEKVTRMKWTIDNEIPVFTKDRDYINCLLATDDDQTV